MTATVTVTITQGGNTLNVNTTDADPAFLGLVPSAVETMTAQWGQATSRDHPDPGKLTLQLILATADHPAIEYESLVVVYVTVEEGRAAVPVWRGWVDDITITKRVVHDPDTHQRVTTWAWTLTVGDVLARAAATKINIAPMPAQVIFSPTSTTNPGRLQRIADACPFPLVQDGIWTGTLIEFPQYEGYDVIKARPRDVDNQPVLTLLQETVNAGGLHVHESLDGCTLRHVAPGLRSLAWITASSGVDSPFLPPELRSNNLLEGAILLGPLGSVTNQQSGVYDLDGGTVVETPRQINRGTILNEVSIGWYVSTRETNLGPLSDPAEVTYYERNTTRQASTSQQRVAGDLWDYQNLPTDPVPSVPPGPIKWVAQSWLYSSAQPTRTTDTWRIITSRVPADVLEPLITLGVRGCLGVFLTNGPDDLTPAWRVLGGELQIRGGRTGLTLKVEPAQLSGQSTLTWDDLPDPASTTYDDGTSTPVVGPQWQYCPIYNPLRWNHLGLVTRSAQRLFRKV